MINKEIVCKKTRWRVLTDPRDGCYSNMELSLFGCRLTFDTGFWVSPRRKEIHTKLTN